jgi:hypothetical protein
MVADPISTILARKYNYVTQMDCIQKTNKYKMTLLNVMGITPYNKTFLSALLS